MVTATSAAQMPVPLLQVLLQLLALLQLRVPPLLLVRPLVPPLLPQLPLQVLHLLAVPCLPS